MESRSLKYISEACEGELLGGSPNEQAGRVCTDSRHAGTGDLFFALAGERFDAHNFLGEVAAKGVAVIVAERQKLPPGFSACPVIAVENTRAALGRFAARYRRDFDASVIAVGGSNGKTTTKELLGSVLRQARPALWSEASFNNDIGVPLTLLRLDSTHRAAVVEAGTNHPGELKPLLQTISPKFGVITNIGREHLEFFGDLSGVAQEEGTLGEALPEDGVLFLNGDDSWAGSLAKRTKARVLKVGLNSGNDWRAKDVRFHDAGVSFWVTGPAGKHDGEYSIQLLGRHQVINALLALAVGAELGLSSDQIRRGLHECAPAKMRLQLWNCKGVRVVEDCYNANADSMAAALRTLAEMPCNRRRVAVLGDMGELGSQSAEAHLEVGRQVAKLGIDELIAVGSKASGIGAAAREHGLGHVRETLDVEAAARFAGESIRPGDLVLIKASRSMKLERVTEHLKHCTWGES